LTIIERIWSRGGNLGGWTMYGGGGYYGEEIRGGVIERIGRSY
jgi:hypothetical protein